MSDRDFGDDMATVLGELSRESRRCPAPEALLAYADGKLAPNERDRVQGHVEVCDFCTQDLKLVRADSDAVDDIGWRRVSAGLERREMPWRQPTEPAASRWPRWLAAAAGLLAAVALTSFWVTSRPQSPSLSPLPSPSPMSEVRGAGIVPMAPLGDIDEWPGFVWQLDVPIEATFEVELTRFDSDEVLWSETVNSGDRPAGALDVIDPGTSYRWRVRALSGSGTPLAESTWTSFRLSATLETPDPDQNEGQ